MLRIDNCDTQNSLRTLEELKKTKIPLYLWGAGNVADEVYKLLTEENIQIAGVFVDASYEDRLKFGQYEIETLEEILRNNKTVNVMIGHAQYHRKAEMENFEGVNKVYYLLNPFKSHDDISYSYYTEHKEEYERAYSLFQEEFSKDVFQAYLNTRINDRLDYLLECFDRPVTYYDNGVFQLSETESYVDIGAYNGDTVMSFVRSTSGKYEQIYAFEPDEELFRELQHNVKASQYRNINLYQLGLWNCNGQLSFVSESGQSDRAVVGVDTANKIDVVTLDSVLGDKMITLIKCSMSAGTRECIEGAERILREQKPKLIINVGITKQMLYQIPIVLYEMNHEYRFALRFIESMPSRLILFAY